MVTMAAQKKIKQNKNIRSRIMIGNDLLACQYTQMRSSMRGREGVWEKEKEKEKEKEEERG